MVEVIEYTVMDYEGEPAIIKNGHMYEPRTPYDCETGRYAVWNSDECDWEFEPVDEYGNDARDYGRGWYDCNTDWRRW